MSVDKLEFEVLEYVQTLTGKDSIMNSTKQTSVRLATSSLEAVDALAEMGKRSRNQIINDALYFGLELIRNQFDEDDQKRYFELFIKQVQKHENEGESDHKIKES
jgi:metal-responsive CopG/Arc/MetJ family transcriptional regulator